MRPPNKAGKRNRENRILTRIKQGGKLRLPALFFVKVSRHGIVCRSRLLASAPLLWYTEKQSERYERIGVPEKTLPFQDMVTQGGSGKLPALFGKHSLPENTLREDKKACEKIGPLGMGKRALYLNSFYISRRYYTAWTDIKRVYKLVAMSKGGFTGIGAFGAMSYFVVELRDGRTKRCQIKYENQVDEALAWIAEHHPEIPTQSEAARKKLREAQEAEEKRYKKDLTPEEKDNIRA